MSRKETEFLFRQQAQENLDYSQGTMLMDNDDADEKLIFDVTKGRSEDFAEASSALSEYIKNLSLSQEQNNELVQRAVNAVVTAERDAFIYAFNIVLSAAEAAEEEDTDLFF